MVTKLVFSVVIPTYNRAALLKRALDSLVEQTFKNFEVIVCNDGSTDNTKEVVNSFKGKLNIKYHWEKNWGGPARPRNIGVKLAQAEWIVFLDSDDYCLPQKLESYLPYLNDYDVIYHDLEGIKVSKNGGEVKQPVFDNLLLADGNISLIPSSSCVRKIVIEKVGGTDEEITPGVEDYDLWLKIAFITNRFKYIPKSLGVYHIEGENNIHYNIIKMYKGNMQTYSKYAHLPIGKVALYKRQLHYFPYLAVFYKKEALKIFTRVAGVNLSFIAGCLLLVVPAFISKALIKIITRYWFKEYAYLTK